MRVSRHCAIVTGAGSGLGLATAELLHSQGANVVIVDRSKERLRSTAARLEKSVECLADVTDPVGIARAISVACDKFGEVHIVVNCAGIASSAKILAAGRPHELDLWNEVIAVNLTGTFNVVRMAAARMAENRPDEETGERGVIICTASIAAFDGRRGQVAYATSKAAVAGMMLPVARDLSEHAIRCAAIAPGLFDTSLLDSVPEKARRALERSLLYPRRSGRPEEYAALVLHIVENPYVNGTCVRLDGGARL